MDFSNSYHLRKEKLKNLEVPTITETKKSLGENLTQLFIKQCPQSLMAEMSLEQKLNGPGPDLWTSPSDLLINKLVLKPPLTNKHIKALTHEGILEIGYQVELKKKKIQDEELKKALYEQEVWLRFMAAKEREKAVMDAITREQELFRLKLMKLNEEFEELVQNLLAGVEERLRESYEEMLAIETEKILREQQALWSTRIEEAVEETVNTLTCKFLKELELQEKEIVEVFKAKMDAEKEKYVTCLEAERNAFHEMVKYLKHNIHCNNIANLMYMLCAERRKCFMEQSEIVNNYEEQLNDLKIAKAKTECKLEQLQADYDKSLIKIKVREECMRRILEQFQKFINFALREVPVQAEFLLDINKMMTFELAQAIAKLDHLHPCKQLMPWRTVDEIPTDYHQTDLEDKYHDCLNELDPPVDDEEEFGADEMFAVKYNNRLYVREDFRNMISTGEEIKPNNMIWSKDVENLINVLKESVVAASIDIPSLQNDKSQFSNVHFHSKKSLDQDESFGIGILAAHDSIELQKSARSHSAQENEQITNPSCAILASPDSLTIVKNIDRSPLKDADRSKELIVKHFSCDTLNLSVRKHRDSTRHSIDVPCKTLSEEAVKLICHLKKKKNEESKEFKDVATSTTMHFQGQELPTKTSRNDSDSTKRKRKGMSLVFHKDSLELAKSNVNVEEAKLKDLLRPDNIQKNATLLLDIPVSDIVKDINFEPVAKIYADLNLKNTYRDSTSTLPTNVQVVENEEVEKENFLEKPGVAKVLGKEGTEHLQSNHEFTVHRIHSIVDMLKNDDSLIRMFTRCNQ